MYKENLKRLQNGEITVRELAEANGIKYASARTVLSRMGFKVKKQTKEEIGEWASLSQEDRDARIKVLGDKLDAGRGRMILESFLYTPNDILTSDPTNLTGTLIMTLKGFHDAYGMDGLGMLGNYTKKQEYENIMELLNDLSYVQEVKKDLRETSAHWQMIPTHLRNLGRLYTKYGQRVNERINDRVQLEHVIRRLVLTITPTIIDEISTMMTLNAGRGGGPFMDNMGRLQTPRFAPKMFTADRD